MPTPHGSLHALLLLCGRGRDLPFLFLVLLFLQPAPETGHREDDRCALKADACCSSRLSRAAGRILRTTRCHKSCNVIPREFKVVIRLRVL